MKFLLFIFSILAFLVGAGILLGAKTSIHEIQGFVIVLIAAIFFTGAAVIDAIDSGLKRLVEELKPQTPAALTAAVPKPGDKGICPNCLAEIPLLSAKCPHCAAEFGPQATWQVTPA